MSRQDDNFVNPLTGVNGRGFRGPQYSKAAEKQACRDILQKALPAGYTLVSFRYKPFGFPQDSVTEIKVQRPDLTIDTFDPRAPIDKDGRTWGGIIPTVLAAFLKAQYP